MVPLVYILSLLEFSSKNGIRPNKQKYKRQHYLQSVTDQEQVLKKSQLGVLATKCHTHITTKVN